MAAEEDKNESPVSSGNQSGGGGSKAVLALTAINLLATIAIVAILFISFQREKKRTSVEDIAAQASGSEDEGEGKAKKGEGKEGKDGKDDRPKKSTNFGRMVTLDQFTVNLSTPGSVNPRFVRVNVSIEVPNEDGEQEVNGKMPQVRNTIIDLFNSKKPADLATAEGRDYLKEEIRNALNNFLVTGKVKGVFFTNFALTS